jgi:hypothetical protein
LFNRPVRAVFIWKTRHAAPLFPSAIPSKTLAAVFIGKFRPPENSSYRVQSPRIAATPTFFARAADWAVLPRAQGNTVKSPEMPLFSVISGNSWDVAESAPNFPYRQGRIERKNSSTNKFGQRPTWLTVASTSQSQVGREDKSD